MALRRNTSLRTTNPLRRGKSISKKGSRSLAWEKCRSEKAQSDVDEDGLIHCEDYKLGLKRCGVARPPEEMHLHHSEGRDGNLLTDKSKLVWLTDECHGKVHPL